MANSAGIILPQQTPANTTIPASGQVIVFNNQSAAGATVPAPYWMDSGGTSHAFGTMGAVSSFTTYNVQDYGVLPSATAATNSTNIATLIATATTGSVIFFPSGTYQFASAIAVGAKFFRFQGNGQYLTVLQTTSATADLFTLTDSNWYTEFWDMSMGSSLTKTAGNMVTTGTASGAGNVGINVRRCTIGNAGSGTNIFNGLVYAGTQSGNITAIEDCTFVNFANFGIQILGNTSTPATACNMYIENCTMNGALSAGNAVAGINVTQCGSLLVANCDIISCATNLLCNPATGTSSGVFSIYAVACYFDQATSASLAFSGTGNIQRSTFLNCWFTTSSAASTSAILINSTATTLPTGIIFDTCSIYNTQSAATAFGINATGIKDIKITNCAIAGWNDGIAVTPGTAAGTTSVALLDNVIGPVGGIALNTTGILLNAGSFTYGTVTIHDNNLSGNTATLTDNSAAVVKSIRDNIGCALEGSPSVAATGAINTTATILATANVNAGLQIGTTFKMTCMGTCTASVANASTFTVRFGTAGTTSDGTIATGAVTSAATGTTIPFIVELWLTVRTVGSGTSATVAGSMRVTSTGLATGTSSGIQAFPVTVVALTPTAFSSLINGIISIGYVSAATTTTSTFQNAFIEVIKA